MPRSFYYWRVCKEDLSVVYYKAQTVDQIINHRINEADYITDINRMELSASYLEEMYKEKGLIDLSVY